MVHEGLNKEQIKKLEEYEGLNKEQIKKLEGLILIKIRCPNCKSRKIWKSGFAMRISGKIQLYQCKKCGHKFREI